MIPAGVAILKTFARKLPLIRALFGSSERINDGIPIVNILISVICDGSNGYWIVLITEKIASRNEKIFFVRGMIRFAYSS